MLNTIEKLFAGVAVVASVGAVSAPAFAMSFSTTNPVKVFVEDPAGVTKYDPNYNGDLTDILDGTATAATGNVELNDLTDKQALPNFLASDTKGTLTANFDDGTDITFSSLTAKDWFGDSLDTSYGANNFANEWFNKALASNGGQVQNIVNQVFGGNTMMAFNTFLARNGFQRLSDPNIAYVNKTGGTVTFGLAGHKDAGQVFNDPLLQQLFTGVFASEVVKVAYKGETSYKYSFDKPIDSGVVNEDGFSHNGTFEFKISDEETKVPEPSVVLGLIAVGGLFAASKNRRV